MTAFPELGPGEMMLPERMQLTPSKIDPWRGRRRDGQLYTDQQLKWMMEMRVDKGAVETVLLRDVATAREFWWPKGSKAPVFVMPCPVLERQPDKIKVLTPAAFVEWVRGIEVRRPKRIAA